MSGMRMIRNSRSHETRLARGVEAWLPSVLTLALLFNASCAPSRRALTAPLLLSEGATPVPAAGVGISVDAGDGLRGPELRRTEYFSFGLRAGVAERVSVSFNGFEDARQGGTSGAFVRAKLLLANPFGPRSSLGLHSAAIWAERVASDLQNDELRAFDLAVPLEFLLSPTEESGAISFFVGPRILFEDYTDNLNPSESVSAVIAGILGGVHLRLGHLHLFGESSVVYVPEASYMGQTNNGRLMVVPTGGIVFHIGSPYKWSKVQQ